MLISTKSLLISVNPAIKHFLLWKCNGKYQSRLLNTNVFQLKHLYLHWLIENKPKNIKLNKDGKKRISIN